MVESELRTDPAPDPDRGDTSGLGWHSGTWNTSVEFRLLSVCESRSCDIRFFMLRLLSVELLRERGEGCFFVFLDNFVVLARAREGDIETRFGRV